MKTKILLLILISIHIHILGQNYTPFNFKDGIWICDFGYFGEGMVLTEEQYYTNGDTIIGGDLYFKLFNYNKEINNSPEPDKVIFNGYYGAIRNIDNRQVEIIYYFNDYPEVIYDFNLSVGDTIKNGFGSHDVEIEPLIVHSVDSVEYCGKFHKRFNLNDNSIIQQTLIEGIGFNSGFIQPFFYQFEQESSLRCYTERNNDNCEPCDLLLTKKVLEQNFNIDIFPNPNSGFLYIRSDKYIVEYSLINQMGQIIYSNSNLNNKELSLKTDISIGIYILKIKTFDQKIYLKKIVIN